MSEPSHTSQPIGRRVHPGVWCIVVAGGSGARFGELKQFSQLSGSRVIDHSIEVAAAVCEGVVVVVPPSHLEAERKRQGDRLQVTSGGASRSESVRNGLAVVPSNATTVLVHDAARPLATAALFESVIEAVSNGAAGVIPATPLVDTLRYAQGGHLDRDTVRAIQTPQGFTATVLRSAHDNGGDATDDATLVEAAGHVVATVEGERSNLKITEPLDLVIAQALLDARATGDFQ